MREIRIKYEEGISDHLAVQLVESVIRQGKISNEGKNYCFATSFTVNGNKYMVVTNDKTKSIMFYVTKEN